MVLIQDLSSPIQSYPDFVAAADFVIYIWVSSALSANLAVSAVSTPFSFRKSVPSRSGLGDRDEYHRTAEFAGRMDIVSSPTSYIAYSATRLQDYIAPTVTIPTTATYILLRGGYGALYNRG
ncbi:hypothetical protein R3P38DRAFT_3347710 [Favolaschia claudopus]|uniref:Uncharacterized protein n=1 Tax=Favolaschia claudopus TaxID=2862362 RepID=A0AAW0CWN6_9AGAR